MHYPEKKPEWAPWYHLAAWRRLRKFILARDPICKLCERAASTVVDHIKPHKGDPKLFWDAANLQGSCESCHNKKTATEDGGFGNPVGDKDAPVVTGEPGKQFVSSAVGDAAIDAALAAD